MSAAQPDPRGRTLTWPGAVNVRDLGGLPTVDGGRTRPGALVRADALDRLTAPGWEAVLAHGVRTVVDLRDGIERGPDTSPRPGTVTTVHVPLEEDLDPEFHARWFGSGLDATPLYYGPYLAAHADRIARVVRAVVDAGPGGVAVHCAIGRDRTGLAALVLLRAAGALREDVVADYLHSDVALRDGHPEHADVGDRVAELLAAHGTDARTAIGEAFDALDVTRTLSGGGLGPEDLRRVRHRLVVGPGS